MILTTFEKAKKHLLSGGEIKVIVKKRNHERVFSLESDSLTIDDTEMYFGEWYIVK